MGKRILISFSGERYHESTKLIVENGPRLGCDEVFIYDDIWLKEKRPEFCKTHAALFEKKCAKAGVVRGVCWFLWKSYIVIDALNRCEAGDTVCFCDGDTWPIADMSPLFDICDRDGVALFAACGHTQRKYSKRDTQKVMEMDDDYWRDKQHAVARFMLFKKDAVIRDQQRTKGSIGVTDFLNEWFKYTTDIRANTFDESTLAPEYSDLIEPRCEQAILTNLAHKYGIPLHREADQWGNGFEKDFPDDEYPQIFYSTGEYSYDPNPLPGQKGSRFRNVND